VEILDKDFSGVSWLLSAAPRDEKSPGNPSGDGPGFLILLTRVPCPCLSVFWRDRAGIFVLLFFLLTRWFESAILIKVYYLQDNKLVFDNPSPEDGDALAI